MGGHRTGVRPFAYWRPVSATLRVRILVLPAT